MKLRKYTSLILLIVVVTIILVFFGNRIDQVFPFLNAILMIGIPLILGLYLARRFKLDLGLFGVGAMTFIIAQVFHIPFNQWLLHPLMERLNLYPAPGSLDLAIAGLFFGLSAGLFEETARYIVYRRWLKENRSWEEGLMFGAGHGGIEAIIFGFLAMWGFLQLVTFRDLNPETLLAVLGQEKGELIQAYLVTYWDAPWYYNFLGAVERMSAICIHLGATLLVLQAFIRKNIGWYILAVLWHTAVDAFAVYGITTWNVYIVEGVIALFGIGSLGIVFALRKQAQITKGDFHKTIVEPIPPLSNSDEPDEITQEKLDESQYE